MKLIFTITITIIFSNLVSGQNIEWDYSAGDVGSDLFDNIATDDSSNVWLSYRTIDVTNYPRQFVLDVLNKHGQLLSHDTTGFEIICMENSGNSSFYVFAKSLDSTLQINGQLIADNFFIGEMDFNRNWLRVHTILYTGECSQDDQYKFTSNGELMISDQYEETVMPASETENVIFDSTGTQTFYSPGTVFCYPAAFEVLSDNSKILFFYFSHHNNHYTESYRIDSAG